MSWGRRNVVTALMASALAVAVAGCGADLRSGSSTTTTGGAIFTLPPLTSAAPGSSQRPTTTASSVPVVPTNAPTTATTRPPQTTASTVITVVPSTTPQTIGALDWDGVHWDYGRIVSAEKRSGFLVVGFDRQQLQTADGTQDANTFTTEPVLYGNTDAPNINANTKVRHYSADAGVEIVKLANPHETEPVCNDAGISSEPVWSPVSESQFLSGDYGTDQTALTFDSTGHLIRIRMSEGC